MSKIRQHGTAKYAVQRAMTILPVFKIADEIGRSADLVYKLSDPDRPHEISVEAALVIDRLCHGQNGMTPFTDLFREQIEGAPREACHVKEHLIKCQAALGLLSQTVLTVMDEHRKKTRRLSPHDLQATLFSIEALEKEIGDIKAAAIAASKEAAR